MGARRAQPLRLRHEIGAARRARRARARARPDRLRRPCARSAAGLEHATVADAYDTLMFARAVKTPTEIELLRRATALNRAAIERTVKIVGEGHALARAESRLPRGGARPRRLRARSRRHGMGPSARRRGRAHAADRPGGLRGRARPARDVRLPRHARPVLLGRRQDLGGRRRAAGRGQAQSARDGAGRRAAGVGHEAGDPPKRAAGAKAASSIARPASPTPMRR